MSNLKNEVVEDKIKMLECVGNTLKKGLIEKVYSITPSVLNIEEGGYWGNDYDDSYALNKLNSSLVLKYNAFYGKSVPLDTVVFTSIVKKNSYPIVEKYSKNRNTMSFLCDKFELVVDSSTDAQNIAQFSCGVGLGARGSRGFGFSNPKRLTISKKVV